MLAVEDDDNVVDEADDVPWPRPLRVSLLLVVVVVVAERTERCGAASG